MCSSRNFLLLVSLHIKLVLLRYINEEEDNNTSFGSIIIKKIKKNIINIIKPIIHYYHFFHIDRRLLSIILLPFLLCLAPPWRL